MLDIDRQLVIWINGHHHPVLDCVLYPVALVGEFGAIWIVACLTLLASSSVEHKRTAILLGVTLLLVDNGPRVWMSHLFPRERPYLALEGIRQLGFAWKTLSFPSGHAHSVVIGGILVGKHSSRMRVPLFVFAFLTMYSRPYCGMHYPLDVIAGALLGACAGLLVTGIERLLARHASRQKKDSGECTEVRD